MTHWFGALVLLAWRTARVIPLTWRHRSKVFEQFYEIGNASLLMSCVLSLFIGGVLALQTGPTLVERGLAFEIGHLVGLSMCKELAPVMMAILIAGRIGSAMAAEIGSMKVYQEIDALRTMNINPVVFLVLPRMIAILLALPMLVMFSILVGWMGGAMVSVVNPQIGITYAGYMSSLEGPLHLDDLAHGVTKSILFAGVIGLVSCHQGLQTEGGPRAIGQSVTQAVVRSIVLILILDYFITRFFIYFE